MAINFKLVPRKNPQDNNADPKFYAKVVPTGKRNLRYLSERVSAHTTMSAPDVYGVLMALEEEIVTALQNGAQVDLGDLCIFYPSLQSDGVVSEVDFNVVRDVKQKGIRIRTKQKLGNKMKDVPTTQIK